MAIHSQMNGRGSSFLRIVPALVLLLLLIGCESEKDDLPTTVPVTGSVTYNGEPLEHAVVMFFPEDGTAGNPGMAETAADGSFTLTTYEFGDGAIPGKHAVTVQLFDQPISIPKHYGTPETTPLEFTVEPKQMNRFDIIVLEE